MKSFIVYTKYFLLIFISFLLTSCGSESSSTNSSKNTKIGHLIDSPIAGIKYSSISGNLEGITGKDGRFEYFENTGVRFSIGDVTLGEVNSVNGDSKVLPNDLLGISRNNINNEDTIKMLVFLQSLDEDGNPNNGIKITKETEEKLSNFAQRKNIQEESFDNVNSILTSIGKIAVSKDSAIEHMVSTLKKENIVTVIDNNPPNITLQSNYVTSLNPQIYGSIDDSGAKVTLEVDNKLYNVEIDAENGTWRNSQLINSLTEGSHAITVRAIDKSQNLSTIQSFVTVDSQAPSLNLTNIENNTYYIKNSFVSITGNVNDPTALISIQINDINYTATNNRNGTWTFSNDVFDYLLEQSYSSIVYAKDEAGNMISQDFTIVIDRTIPTLNVDKTHYNTTRPTVSGTVSESVKTLKISLGGRYYIATVDDNTHTWIVSDVYNLRNSSYQMNIIAYDYAGNFASTIKDIYIQLPNQNPIVGFENLIINDSTPPLSGTISDNNATIKISIKEGANTIVSELQATNLQNGNWQIADDNITNLPDGIYDIIISATDRANNIYSIQRTLTIDTEIPDITMISLSTTDTTPLINGTFSSDTKSLALTIDNHNYIINNNHNSIWNQTITSPLSDGNYSVTLVATDYANNINTIIKNDAIQIDSTLPDINLTSILNTTDDTPLLNGFYSDEHNISNIKININGSEYTVSDINTTNSSWKYQVDSNMSNGSYPVILKITDDFGNEYTTNPYTLRIDLLAPIISYTPIHTNDRRPRIYGTIDEEPTSLIMDLNGTEYNLSVTNNTWELPNNNISEANALADGNISFTIRAQDSFGNDSNFTSYIMIDSTPPTITINPTQTNSNLPDINGTIDDNSASVIINIHDHNYTASVINNTWHYTFLTILNDGNHSVKVIATDQEGNSADVINSIFIDTLAPTIPDLNITSGTFTNRDDNITILITGEALSSLIVNNIDTLIDINSSGQIKYDLNITGIDKIYDFNITLKDRLLNGSLIKNIQIIKDRYAPHNPAIISLSQIDDNNYTNNTSITAHIQKEINSTIKLYDTKNNNTDINITNYFDINATDMTITFNIPQQSTEDNTSLENNISVIVSDLAGNESNATYIIFSQGKKPKIPKVTLSQTSTNSINVDATIYGNNGEHIYVNGADILKDINTTGSKTISLDTSGDDAEMIFNIALGNDAGIGQSKQITIIKDATPPNIPTIKDLNYPYEIRTTQNSKILKIEGTEINATVCINDNCNYKLENNNSLIHLFELNGNDGIYEFVIKLKDALENESSSISLKIEKDTTPPLVPDIINIPQYTDNTNVSVTVKGEVGATVFYLRDGFHSYLNTNKVITDDGSVVVDLNTSGDDGNIHFDLVLDDELHNRSNAKSFDIEVDRSIPELPTIVGVSPFYTNQTSIGIDMNFTETGDLYINNAINQDINSTGIHSILIDNYTLNNINDFNITLKNSTTNRGEGYLSFIIEHNNSIPKDLSIFVIENNNSTPVEINATNEYYTNQESNLTVSILGESNNKLFIRNIYKDNFSLGGATTNELNITGNDGNYTYEFYSQNKFGSLSPTSNITIIKDTVPPAKPSLTILKGIDDNNYTNQNSIKFNLKILENNATIRLYDINNNNHIIKEVSNASRDINISFDVPQDGNNSILLSLIDLAKNETNSSNQINIMFEKGSKPMAPMLESIDAIVRNNLIPNLYYTNKNSVALNIKGEAEAKIYLESQEEDKHYTQIDINDSGYQTIYLDTQNLSQTRFDFNVSLNDGTYSDNLSLTIIKDDVSPNIPQILENENNTSSLPSITTQPSLLRIIKAETNSTVYVNHNNTKDKIEDINHNGEFTYLFLLPLEGDNEFNITSKDLVGNSSPTLSVVVKKDTTPPLLFDDNITVPQYTHLTTTNIEVRGEDGATIHYRRTDNANSNVYIDTNQTISNGKAIIPIDTNTSDDTTLTYQLILYDEVLNDSLPISFSIIRDNNIPEVPSLETHLPILTKLSSTTIEINTKDGRLFVNDVYIKDVSEGFEPITISNLVEGNNDINITLRSSKDRYDGVLNFNITKDSIAPISPDSNLTSILYTNTDLNSTSITVHRFENNTSLNIDGNNTHLILNDTNFDNDENSTVDVNITGVDGNYTYNLISIDDATNDSNITTITIIKDRIAPNKPTFTFLDGVNEHNYTNKDTVSINVIKPEENLTINLYDANDENKSIIPSRYIDINNTSTNITFNVPQNSANIEHNITIRLKDLAHNESNNTNIVSVIFEKSTKPMAPLLVDIEAQQPTNFVVNTYYTSASSVELNISGEANTSIYLDDIDTLKAINESGFGTINLDTEVISNGDYKEFNISLGADNSSNSLVLKIIKDDIAPNTPTQTTLPAVTAQPSLIGIINAEPNSRLYINNQYIAEINASGSYTYLFNFTNEGNNNFSMMVKDLVGNDSQTFIKTVRKDTIAPLSPSVDSPIYTDGNLTSITVTGEPDTTINYKQDSWPIYLQNTATIGSNGSVTFDINTSSNSDDTNISFSLFLYDEVFNDSPVITFSIYRDITIPEVPTRTNAESNYTNSDTKEIELNFEDNGTLYINNSSSCIIDGSSRAPCEINDAPANHNVLLSTSGADGNKAFTIMLKNDNLRYDGTLNFNIIKDSIAPQKPIANPMVLYTNTELNSTVITIHRFEDNTSLNIDGNNTHLVLNNANFNADENSTVDVNITGVDGNYTYNLISRDKAINDSNITTVTIIKDRVSPLKSDFIFINQSVDDNNYTNKSQISIRLTKSEANSIIKLYDKKDGNASINFTEIANSPIDINITFAISQSGENNISLTLTDIAGNESDDTNISQTTSIIFTKGSSPMAPIVVDVDAIQPNDSAPNVYYTNSTQVNTIIKGDENASIFINGDDSTIDISSSGLATVGLNTEGDDGSFDFNITFDDSSSKKQITIIKDSLAPSAPIVSSLPTITSQDSIVGTISGEVNSTVWINGSKKGILDSGSINYLFIFNEGDNDFNITLKDLVGNKSAIYAVNVEKDTTAPNTPTLSVTPRYTKEDTTSIEVNGEKSATILVNGINSGTIELDGSTIIDLNTSLEVNCTTGDKNIEFNIVLKDDMNLTSIPLSFTLTKDGCAPEQPKFTSYAPTHTSSDSLTLDLYRNENNVDIYVNGTKDNWNHENGNYASYVFDTTMPQGSKNFSITYIDKAGNQSPILDYSVYRDNKDLYIVSAVYSTNDAGVDDDTVEIYFSEDVKYDTIDKSKAEYDYNITDGGSSEFSDNSVSDYNTTQYDAHLNYQLITLGAGATAFKSQPRYHHNFDNNYTKINIFGTIEDNPTIRTRSIIGASLKDSANIPPKEFNRSIILRFDIPLQTGQIASYEDYDGHISDDSTYTNAGKVRQYTDDDNVKVTDDATKLIWQDNGDIDTTRTHADAIGYCADLDFDGQTDWRLPTIDELLTLPLKEGNTLDDAFSHGTDGGFWSSTNYQRVEHNYWTISMSDGADGNDNEDNKLKVRCIRGPE